MYYDRSTHEATGDNTAKNSVIAVEAGRENHQAVQEPQMNRPIMPPPSQEDREERHTAQQQQRIKEELAQIEKQPKDSLEQQKVAWTQEDDGLITEMLGGETEEQINAHNEWIKADSEKEQLKKEALREEALRQYEKHQARLAAMTPEEREEWKRQRKLKPLTEEEFRQLMAKMHANVLAMQRKRAEWLHARDPRYDPMTGDLLEPDEHPLSPTSEYTFYGKTRARSFLSPDSPLLKHRKPLQTDGEGEAPEIESHERLVERLLKAGFVEVEPVLADKASFEQTQWFRNLSPSEKMHYLDEEMRKMRGDRYLESAGFKDKTTGEKVAKFIAVLFTLLLALLGVEEYVDKPTQKSD